MVTRGRISLLALALAALLAGCGGGGDGEIPAEDAEVLERRLNEIEQAVAAGNCTGPESAEASANLLIEQVSEGEQSVVPRRVDDDVHEQLKAAAANLAQLVAEQCIEVADPEEPPDDEPIDPIDPIDPIEPPEDEPPEDEPPEDGEDDSGQGGGNNEGGNQGQGRGNQNPGGGTAPPTGGTESG